MSTEQALTAPQAPSKPPAEPKKRRISKKLRKALDLLASVEGIEKQAAAHEAGITPEHLSRSLNKDHVQAYLTRKAKRHLTLAVLRASNVKVDLLAAESERVRSDVASEVLALQGIKPVEDKRASVNINITPGYVINLSQAGDQAKVVDADSRDEGIPQCGEDQPQAEAQTTTSGDDAAQ